MNQLLNQLLSRLLGLCVMCSEHSCCNMVHALCARVCLQLLPSDKLERWFAVLRRKHSLLTLCKCRQRKTSKIFVYGRAMSSSCQSTSCQAPDSHVRQTWLFNILPFTAKFQSPFRSYRLFWYDLIAVFPKSTSEVVFSRYRCCLARECTQWHEGTLFKAILSAGWGLRGLQDLWETCGENQGQTYMPLGTLDVFITGVEAEREDG